MVLFAPSILAQKKENKSNFCESCPKHLKYYEYWDADSSILNAKGHYCHGLPCKTWRYYHQNGKRKLYRIAIYQNGAETELVRGPEYPLYFE